ncbi:MAG: DUF58 domain-containing protein [Polaromonas sp.]
MTASAVPGAKHYAAFGVVASLNELIGLRAHGQTGLVARQCPTIAASAPGAHFSQRKSRGMEFAAARPYQSGDDARAIDWRQTARRGRPYTKLFQEEHERPVQLLVDLGPGMRFGTRIAFKSVVAARAAALLAWRAVASGDRVGGLVWNGAELRAVRPQGRHHGVLTLLAGLAAVSAAPPAAQGLTLATPLRALAHSLRPGSLVIVISDFTTLDGEAQGQLVALAKTAELMLLHVYDSFEAQAPPPGRYRITDGQHSLSLDLRSPEARSAYGAAFAERRLALEQLARRTRATLVPLATHLAPETVLAPTLRGGAA